MAESRPLYLGPRIKRLRRELGLTQQGMADDLGISGSYVALIERNQRPLTADLLLRLARTYRLDVAELAADDGQDYARRIADILRDPIFDDIDLPALEIADLASNFPGVSEALLRLYGSYTREQAALAEQRLSVGDSDATDAIAEARRFFNERRNYIPALDDRAGVLAGEIAEAGGLADWIRARGTRVRFLPGEVLMDTLRRHDRHNNQLLIDDTLDLASRNFQLATHIAYTAMRGEIARIVRGESFSGTTAATLVRRSLANYAAAALVMPYDRFARAVVERRYDMEALARLFDCSFEQVAHRLTTLNRPGEERVPFFFLRVDEAGNVSKRLDGAGFPFASHGGGCPLWTVHSVFRTPGQIVTQWLDLPDGQRFFSVARTVMSGGGRHDRRGVMRAVALACAAEHAGELVYAEGQNPAAAPATPIGLACSLCHREACIARSVPPIGREILADDFSRAPQPFSFSGN